MSTGHHGRLLFTAPTSGVTFGRKGIPLISGKSRLVKYYNLARWMFPKIGVPKMDGENNGSKPYEQMDDLGVFPLFLVQHPYIVHSLGFLVEMFLRSTYLQMRCFFLQELTKRRCES